MSKAYAKFVRMSPRKLRRVINEVRGKNVTDAKTLLKFMPYSAAKVVEKVLKSAIANATNNDGLAESSLKITKAYIDQANTLKRWRPMSRGRGFPILKRVSHVTIEVDGTENSQPQAPKKQKEVKATHEHVHGEHCDHDHEHKHEEATDKPKKTTKAPKAKSSTTKKVTKKKDKE